MPYTDDEWTPARATARTWGWVPFGLNAVAASLIIAGALAAGISLIVYALIPAGTAIQKETNQQHYSATVSGMPYQESLLSQMEQHLNNISGAGGLASTRGSLPADSPEQENILAQELSELRSFCGEGVNLIPGVAPGSSGVYATYKQNCANGAVSQDPPLAPPAGS
jgi:hypothetical protein